MKILMIQNGAKILKMMKSKTKNQLRLKTIVEKADIKFFIPIVDEFDNLNVTGHLVEIQVV